MKYCLFGLGLLYLLLPVLLLFFCLRHVTSLCSNVCFVGHAVFNVLKEWWCLEPRMMIIFASANGDSFKRSKYPWKLMWDSWWSDQKLKWLGASWMFVTFCGSVICEQAAGELSAWVLLPSPSLPVKPPVAQNSWHRTPLSTDALQSESEWSF